MNAKPMWQSKTFWFNVVTLVVMVAGAMSDPQTYGPDIARYAALILPVSFGVLPLLPIFIYLLKNHLLAQT